VKPRLELEVLNVKGCFDAKMIKFKGDLDSTNAETTLDQMTRLMNDGFVKLVADFSGLRYINSMGMGVLMHIHKAAREKMGHLKIACVNKDVYEIFEIVGADKFLEVFPSVEAAVSTVSQDQ
jgi:anti-anti-sigma factor